MNGITAHAAVRAGPDGRGGTRCSTLRSAPPVTWRGRGGELRLVGTSAGPVGGDDIRIDVEVEAGGDLTVRSGSAALHLPGPDGSPSRTRIVLTVGAGGTLRWLPEPAILAGGCDQRTTIEIRLAAGASLVWRDEVILGRHGEAPGSLYQRLRVDRSPPHELEKPLYRNDLAVGPLWPAAAGPAGIGGARAVGTLLVVGPAAAGVTVAGTDNVRAAAMPLAPDAVVVSAVAADAGPLLRLLGSLS